ncbi:MAG: hypothetical protein LBC67_03655 [Spirochaetales bacterium]|jgi:hypothetical protein|nr:hypothetical protein [Spirochaetales bacterium]
MNEQLDRLEYYKPSGTAPLAGAAAALAAGLAAGCVLAAVYAFVNHHDPLVYLNILLTCGFGIALGFIVSRCIKFFRIRSVSAACVIAGAVFAAAYYVHWFFYVGTVIVDFSGNFSSYDALSVFEIALSLIESPEDCFAIARDLNESGVWSINNIDVRGLFLAAIWLAEAGVLCFFTLKAPRKQAMEPYSEREGKWMDARSLPVKAAFIADEGEFKAALGREDYSALVPIKESETEGEGEAPPPSGYAEVTLHSDSCDAYISVQNVTVKLKRKKKDLSKKCVVQYAKLSLTAAAAISQALGGA